MAARIFNSPRTTRLAAMPLHVIKRRQQALTAPTLLSPDSCCALAHAGNTILSRKYLSTFSHGLSGSIPCTKQMHGSRLQQQDQRQDVGADAAVCTFRQCSAATSILSSRVSAMPEGAFQVVLRGAGTSESGDEPGAPAAVDNSAAEGAQDGEERSRLAALAAGSMRVSFATPPPRQVREQRLVDGLIWFSRYSARPYVDQLRW